MSLDGDVLLSNQHVTYCLLKQPVEERASPLWTFKTCGLMTIAIGTMLVGAYFGAQDGALSSMYLAHSGAKTTARLIAPKNGGVLARRLPPTEAPKQTTWQRIERVCLRHAHAEVGIVVWFP